MGDHHYACMFILDSVVRFVFLTVHKHRNPWDLHMGKKNNVRVGFLILPTSYSFD